MRWLISFMLCFASCCVVYDKKIQQPILPRDIFQLTYNYQYGDESIDSYREITITVHKSLVIAEVQRHSNPPIASRTYSFTEEQFAPIQDEAAIILSSYRSKSKYSLRKGHNHKTLTAYLPDGEVVIDWFGVEPPAQVNAFIDKITKLVPDLDKMKK